MRKGVREALIERKREALRLIAEQNDSTGLRAVRALLDSYHKIDASQTDAGLWIEASSARGWNSAVGNEIAANRDAVMQRGRTQV